MPAFSPLPLSTAPAPELLAVFSALPGAHMLLSPGPGFMIEAASDAYLAAALTHQENVVGRPLFEVFPDNPATPEARSVHEQDQLIAQHLPSTDFLSKLLTQAKMNDLLARHFRPQLAA